jgi:hypothetical protein
VAHPERIVDRVVELELAGATWANELRRWFETTERSRRARVLTPTVLEIVAVKSS